MEKFGETASISELKVLSHDYTDVYWLFYSSSDDHAPFCVKSSIVSAKQLGWKYPRNIIRVMKELISIYKKIEVLVL